NIDRAQVNLIILLLLLFFSYYLLNNKESLAGVYLGIAAVFKLTPVLFLVYLLIKKRFKAIMSAIITFTALIFIPSFRWGIERNAYFLKGWARSLGATLPSEYLQHKNQSLMAAISRFFSVNSDVALLKLSQTPLAVLMIIFYALFLVSLIYMVIKSGQNQGGPKTQYDLALFFTAMTVLSPVGTKTTFVYLLMPIAVLIKEVFMRELKDRILLGGLLTYLSLIYLNSSDIIGGELSELLHKYSLMTLGLLIIYFLLGYAKLKKSPAAF
ncbi:MAG: DUF2029 domain-containing protein, partial [Candidatus Omnitrophica bacterium]|nr:DUF2029 domain-containing protein [Candidatus Omnitrophota bacterium]